MERNQDIACDTIDLGTASVETKGPWGPFLDERLGRVMPGLSDD